jgi:uncharacterized protein YndB with AHSA1/START domain
MAKTTEAETTEAKGETLEVRRTIAASAERVFQAWTRPEELKRWAAPGPMATAVAEVDLRVGGSYRIHMREPEGKEHRVVGVYREVDPPRRLVYTWTWETDPVVTDSIVTVEFNERGGSTEVVLRHEKLPTAQKREGHTTGWLACLEQLETVVTSGR